MTASTSAGLSKGARSPGEERVLLHNVSWASYEQLLADFASQSSPRLAYKQGTLEIMTPLSPHERHKYVIERLIEGIALETETSFYCLCSITLKREDLQRGFEPDTCFYFQNIDLISGKSRIDLQNDPPPDLIVEIDISGNSMDKFPICAHLGIREVWRHEGKAHHVQAFREKYAESKSSVAFPSVTSVATTDFIRRAKDLPGLEFMKSLQAWITNDLKLRK